MFEDRNNFFDAIESKLSSASLLLSEPEKFKKNQIHSKCAKLL